ncbi:MAG: tol-pal system YbgF family protein [Bradymonadaceae bacterium]
MVSVTALAMFVSIEGAAQSEGGESGESPPTSADSSSTSTGESDGGESESGAFKKLVQQGKVHFTKGNYEKALAAFQKAYAKKETPNLLFNIGLAAEKNGDLEQALEYYKKFVVSPDVTLKLREKAQKRIDVLEPIVEDQKSREEAKKAAELEQSEKLAATENKNQSEKSSDQESSTSEKTEKDDDEPAGSEAIEGAGGGSPAGGIILTGIGVASIGGGVAFTLMSQQAKKDFRTASSPSARRSARDAAWRNQWIADGLFVAGLGTAIGGAVVLLSRGTTERSEASTALIPALGPDFAGVRIETDF